MFIPGHITGFFAGYRSKNILKTGSIGAGITVNKGVKIELQEGDGKIFYNGKKIKICPVEKVIQQYKKLGYIGNHDIKFSADFPLGSGLGMSGGCALSLSKELFKNQNKIQNNLNLNPIDCVKIAHISEVECGTGLGDVIAQHIKGFVIRKSPGFPINVKKITNIGDEYYVIVEIFGQKETKETLSNPEVMKRINEIGKSCLNSLLKNPTLENFMKLSLKFAIDSQLINDRILSICEDLKFTVGASQSMLGNTLFCISKKETLNDALSILNNPIVCKIYP
ncbi:GHMP kinase [Methanocaldococcus vulcanius M7]|uniref:Pantoate kinase n=1 Tax=Methanocaldococcus vulcanius (strain ATCC 700851 / DSM 12094 / M7) TaxID=579137 RepID=C9RF76_METVM|nr:pantoate kinase [Methanocaldococcus vulcanius]ACX72228.1 GHMP kinase [Methanocaldococcus vulcanius M7]